jgi:hypothetical protein
MPWNISGRFRRLRLMLRLMPPSRLCLSKFTYQRWAAHGTHVTLQVQMLNPCFVESPGITWPQSMHQTTALNGKNLPRTSSGSIPPTQPTRACACAVPRQPSGYGGVTRSPGFPTCWPEVTIYVLNQTESVLLQGRRFLVQNQLLGWGCNVQQQCSTHIYDGTLDGIFHGTH